MNTLTLPRLRKRLKRFGLSQVAVAREARVTPQAVNHFLAGRSASRLISYVIHRMLEEIESRKGNGGAA